MHPEPPMAGQPIQLCAEVANLDEVNAYTATLEFMVAEFGIGLPFWTVGRREVVVPPGGGTAGCVTWIPEAPEHTCIQVRLAVDGYQDQFSQRNIDVDEPLRPGESHSRQFPVRNPFERTVTMTLGLVPHVPPDWRLDLSPDLLPLMRPGQVETVTLTVTPPDDLPPDGTLIVDVEVYVEQELIGGFRKIFHPPIPLHPYPDPIYAEREISVHPYPALAGEPTEICVELRNPTPNPCDQLYKLDEAGREALLRYS